MVHPQHGAAVITKKVKQNVEGSSRDYYVLEIATDQLTVFVPVDSIEEAVRSVISKNQTRKVFQIFKEEPQDAGSNWSRWYKVLNEKMTSGDIYQVAEVIRDLSWAQQTKGISPALKRMLSPGTADPDQRAPLRPRSRRGGGDPASRPGAPQGGEGRGELTALRVGWGFDAHRFGGRSSHRPRRDRGRPRPGFGGDLRRRRRRPCLGRRSAGCGGVGRPRRVVPVE